MRTQAHISNLYRIFKPSAPFIKEVSNIAVQSCRQLPCFEQTYFQRVMGSGLHN